VIQHEGDGWRLARDSCRDPYSVLIGGAGWAIELTENEGKQLVELLSSLEDQHRSLRDQLMEEESIELELERGVWWGCLEGDRSSWNLSLVLSPLQGRGAEVFWPCPAAAAAVAALRIMWDSGH